jgi:hypothetical protein
MSTPKTAPGEARSGLQDAPERCAVCNHPDHGDLTCQEPRMVRAGAYPTFVGCGCYGATFYDTHDPGWRSRAARVDRPLK